MDRLVEVFSVAAGSSSSDAKEGGFEQPPGEFDANDQAATDILAELLNEIEEEILSGSGTAQRSSSSSSM